jgi:hypothetical protein
MATRSTIWYKDEENNCYKGIYCHWDGYLSYNGKILFENYYALDKVKELVSYGSASSIAETLDKCEFYKDLNREDITIYEIQNLKEIDEYLEEYTYIFENEKWFILTGKNKMKRLSPRLIEMDI